MKRALLLILISGLISGCAAPMQVSPMTGTYEFQDYLVKVAYQSADRGCAISGAVLENKGNRGLNTVYTELLSVNKDGLTISDTNINFPATIQGGKAMAAHIGASMVALVPCDAVQFHMKGSNG
jgi:hypothetical protein